MLLEKKTNKQTDKQNKTKQKQKRSFGNGCLPVASVWIKILKQNKMIQISKSV